MSLETACERVMYACVMIVASGAAAQSDRSDGAPILRISSEQFAIEYELNPGGAPIQSVQLWYTTDSGQSWRNYGEDADAISPVIFRASAEGLFGFYIVAVSTDGASSDPPGESTEPHLQAFVDFTPPVVQLHAVQRGDPPTLPQTLHIRWSAIDRNLSTRPIQLDYRTPDDAAWRRIDGPLANTGVYEWQVPSTVKGAFTVRLTVTDRGGHRVEKTSLPVQIEERSSGGQASGESDWNRHPSSASLAALQSASGASRAWSLLEKGRQHTARGEYRLAGSRLRDALSIDPTLTDALVELGDVLYHQRQLPESIEAYRMAVKQRPGSREIREALAAALIGERKFDEAVGQLGQIVRNDPNDVAAWLNLGDIAIYQGDEVLARQHYERAMTLDPAASDIVQQAKLRLADLQRLAAEFRQGTN